MSSLCSGCGQPFEAAKAWHRACWSCWRAEQDRKAGQGAYAQGWYAGQARGYDNGYRHGLDDGTANGAQDNPDLTPLLGDLIALAHPDRHPPERAALAHRATVALLALRSETRQAA